MRRAWTPCTSVKKICPEEAGERERRISVHSIESPLSVREFSAPRGRLDDNGLLIKQGGPSYTLRGILEVHGCPLTHRDRGRSSYANRRVRAQRGVGRSLLWPFASPFKWVY